MNRLTGWIVLCLWFGYSPWLLADEGVADKTLLKVAYVFNLAKFTGWPDSAVNGQFNVCVMGEDVLGDALGQLKGKSVKGRTIAVQTYDKGRNSKRCHLLYVAGSEESRLDGVLKEVGDQPVLTVSELTGFADSGGVVELDRRGGRTRFIINLGKARGMGLEINPHLLKLAEVIGR